MHRCVYCRKFIWPWQHQGQRLEWVGHIWKARLVTDHWHTTCWFRNAQ